MENPSRKDHLGCLLGVHSVVFEVGKVKWNCRSGSKLGTGASGVYEVGKVKWSCRSGSKLGTGASGGVATLVFNFGYRWRWVVSSTPRPFYPQAKAPVNG